jgi:hypothetical protein
MTLFDCNKVMENWAVIFNRDIRTGEYELWHNSFSRYTAESLTDAFKKYHQSMEKPFWPTIKRIKDVIGPAPYVGPARKDGDGQYQRRYNEDDISYMERTCGPDWKERTEKGIRALRKMGVQYGGGVLLSADEWHKMGVSLPEDEVYQGEENGKVDVEAVAQNYIKENHEDSIPSSGGFQSSEGEREVEEAIVEFQEEAPY